MFERYRRTVESVVKPMFYDIMMLIYDDARTRATDEWWL
jgi:hypothetical protein